MESVPRNSIGEIAEIQNTGGFTRVKPPPKCSLGPSKSNGVSPIEMGRKMAEIRWVHAGEPNATECKVVRIRRKKSPCGIRFTSVNPQPKIARPQAGCRPDCAALKKLKLSFV